MQFQGAGPEEFSVRINSTWLILAGAVVGMITGKTH